MDIRIELAQVKKIVDNYLLTFFAQKKVEAAQIDPLLSTLIDYVADMTLRGGDRIRPALCFWGYQACGGEDKEGILPIACTLEVFHTFALIHDDIMDNASTRRGKPTIQKANVNKLKSPHQAISIALLAGDLAHALSDELFDKTSVEQSPLFSARVLFQRMKEEIMYGQYLDVLGGTTEKQIMTIYTYKTAGYTIEKPLRIGAALAGATKNQEEALTRFGKALGIAFQIMDDHLGIFGDEEITGKSKTSDIVEGKQTLMVVKTIEYLQKHQDLKRLKGFLQILGNKNLSQSDYQWFCRCIIDTGAKTYCENKAKQYQEQAKKVLNEGLFDNDLTHRLLLFADFVVNRAE